MVRCAQSGRVQRRGITLIETAVALGTLTLALTAVLALLLMLGREERAEAEAAEAHSLLAALATDLRLSLAAEDAAQQQATAAFALQPLPLAGQVEVGASSVAHFDTAWEPVAAGAPTAAYRVTLEVVRVPVPPSMAPVELVLTVHKVQGRRGQAGAELARLPVACRQRD